MADLAAITNVVNVASFGIFLFLLGATAFTMARRIRDYRLAKLRVPVLLRRSFGLIASLVVVGGESLALRVLHLVPPEGSLERLLLAIQLNIVLLAGMAYYAKVELFDIDREDRV